MATVSSVSTDQQVWDAYDDNASYEEDASITKAQAFVTVCNLLLRRRPASVTADGTAVTFDARAISEALERARSWIATNNTSANGGSVRYWDTRGLRD